MKVFYSLCDSLGGDILKKLTVFCGWRNGASDKYIEGAKKLGKELAKRNITLVYGGASVGIIGAVADSVLNEGGYVIGVIPSYLDNRVLAQKNLSELIIVDSMNERIAKMMDL